MAGHIQAFDCHTVLGGQDESVRALLEGKIGLAAHPVSGIAGSDQVPLALRAEMDLRTPPRWWPDLLGLLRGIPDAPWGDPRYPVILSSSNFGIDHLYQIGQGAGPDPETTSWATPQGIAAHLRKALGWGANLQMFSHACVSAHIALCQAETWIRRDLANQVLLVSFDYLGPFVSCGFHSLKILNAGFPQPYGDQPVGSIGLGDGAAWCVLSKDPSPWRIAATSLWNEHFHQTANDPSGSGFEAVIHPIADQLAGHRFWIKGHGTGTLEAGRLESTSLQKRFPEVPLVSWKGSIGHTLGSCALVELALALKATELGRIPGTVGSNGPFFSDNVAADSFESGAANGILLLSNAFGGAHGALWIRYD